MSYSSLKTRLVILVQTFLWVMASFLGGLCTVFLMGGVGVAIALAGMAGPTHPGDSKIMFFITIPATLIYAFFVRRAGLMKAILGAVIFSLPIVLTCYHWDGESSSQESQKTDRVRHQIAHVTTGVALCASALFAIGGKVSKEMVEQQRAEPVAAPNGGPATPLAKSGVAEGPPSVS